MTYGTLREADPAPYRTPGVGRATEWQDFVPLLESVVFSANQTEANITLQVLDDKDPERDESVFVKLMGADLMEGEQERLSKTHEINSLNTSCLYLSTAELPPCVKGAL